MLITCTRTETKFLYKIIQFVVMKIQVKYWLRQAPPNCTKHVMVFVQGEFSCPTHPPKGSRIFVEGELRTRSWADRETGQQKFRTEVVVHELSLLSQAPATNSASEPEHHADGNGFVPQEFSDEQEIERCEVPY